MTEQRFDVQHRPDESRYVLIDREVKSADDRIIGEESYVDVTGANGRIERVLFHTAVSDDYGGQGLASSLVQQVVEDVIANEHTIVPVCSYVAKWLPKHPEYNTNVIKPKPAHLQAVSDHQKT